MTNKLKVLYISYDGMTDPLGQSQVIPYLSYLSKKNIEIHILSAEKSDLFIKGKEKISEILQLNDIIWHPTAYTKKPAVISTIMDIRKIIRMSSKLQKQYHFDIVHCRSYISAFAGLYLKQKYKVKFLFDMRGFYPDERVDGNLWPQSNPVYKLIYKYFKKKEKLFLSSADYIISLTYAAKDIITDKFKYCTAPISVIPCCADLNHFDFHKINKFKISELRDETGISETDFVLSYLGSIGTWYMIDEMLLFFKILKKHKQNVKFLIITKDIPDIIYQSARKLDISIEDIIIKASERSSVPELLSLSNVSVFFIKPVFSKKASSPTKLAELLGMGIPVICNSTVGDIDKFVPDFNLGLLVNQMDETDFERVILQIDDLAKTDSEILRAVAEEHFSVDKGAEQYFSVYKDLSVK
ncbi:MAG TPA: glycosyltransferase family 4 protein [Bacteroidales bacterium]|nr:glycosyltransferase family 4 protein [Bacteroidales bacterium]